MIEIAVINFLLIIVFGIDIFAISVFCLKKILSSMNSCQLKSLSSIFFIAELKKKDFQKFFVIKKV